MDAPVSETLTSSLARVLSVLNLFDETKLSCTPEEVGSELQVSLPTAYRYIKTLVDAGLLQRVEDSRYMLGPRIIVLDHYIRRADPVLREGIPVMADLVAKTGFDCVMSGLFGDQVLDTHREMGEAPAHLSYGRGRPRPLFQGAAPKVILACFPSSQLRKIFNAYHEEIVRCGLPAEWDELRKYYTTIRRAGHYVSIGELEPQLASVAAPITKADGSVCAALSIVTAVPRLEVVDMQKLTQLVMQAAQQISSRLT
jgi:DNA-binding IclR family transcriptional regulator